MKRKSIVFVVITGMIASLLGGCGSNASTVNAGNGTSDELNIMVWDGTWDEDVFSDFEAETGIHVNVSYIDNTDTIISKLVQGNTSYDLIDIESAYVKTFVDNDLLLPLDHSKIENEQYIDDEYTGFIGDEDEEYTIPCLAPLYTTIVYNKETCPIDITSFSDLADPALEGQVCMVNSTISLFGMALESLGYSADSCDEDEISEATDLLMSIKDNVKAFVGESAVSELETGECSVAYCWDYMTLCNDDQANWDEFAIADIDSGSEYSGTYWGIPKSAKSSDEALELINFMLQPEEYAKDCETWGDNPVLTQESLSPYLDDTFYENPAIDAFKNLNADSWKVAVNDDQIGIMDTYYTKLMSE